MLHRNTPKCSFCGKVIAKAIYKDQSDLPPSMKLIGDTFQGWKYVEHECEEGKKIRNMDIIVEENINHPNIFEGHNHLEKKKQPKILFDEGSATLILNALGFEVAKGSYIINSETKEFGLTKNGEKIKLKQFAGVYKKEDRAIFVKGDLCSLIDFANDRLI